MVEYLRNLLTKYTGSSGYKKNVLVMVGGRVIAQAIPILLTPVLTRIYTPEEFGILGVFLTIVGIVAMISNGRYNLSIILPKDDRKAMKLMILSSLLTIIVTFVFTFISLIWGKGLFYSLNSDVLSKYIPLLLLNILFVGLYEPLFYYALRLKKYKTLSINIIVQSSLVVITRIVWGLFVSSEDGLLISYLVGYVIGYFLLIIHFKDILIELLKGFSWKEYLVLLKEYVKFPKYSLIADTLYISANMAPNIFLNKAFGSAVNGYYSMTDKVLGTPIWFVTSSVGDVFKQEASEQFREKGNCYDIFMKTTKTMIVLGLIPFLLLFLFAPALVSFVFGSNWEPVGSYIRIFSAMYYIKFIVGPISSIVYIVRKQNYNIFFQLLSLLSIIIAFIWGIHFKDLYLSLIVWSVLTSISACIMWFFSYKFAKTIHYEDIKESC